MVIFLTILIFIEEAEEEAELKEKEEVMISTFKALLMSIAPPEGEELKVKEELLMVDEPESKEKAPPEDVALLL